MSRDLIDPVKSMAQLVMSRQQNAENLIYPMLTAVFDIL